MPVYEYTAIDGKGRKKAGIIDGDSPFEARRRMRDAGLFPVSVSLVVPKKKDGSAFFPGLVKRRAYKKEVALATRHLSTLLSAGFTLVAALDMLCAQAETRAFRQALIRVKDAVGEGQSFAGALSLYPRFFPPLYVHLVRAGEASGSLEAACAHLADLLEKRRAAADSLRAALAYPVLMCVVASAVLVLLMVYVVPNLAAVFAEMNRVLPLPTRILMGISRFLADNGLVLAMAILALVVGASVLARTPAVLRLRDRLVFKIPAVGPVLEKSAAATLARTLGVLLENGVPLLDALEMAGGAAGNTYFSEALATAAQKVGEGENLAGALEATGAFPKLLTRMVKVGEQSGALEVLLKKCARMFQQEAESGASALGSLLEPVLILVMGVVVGFIVISVCLPIFEMNRLVG